MKPPARQRNPTDKYDPKAKLHTIHPGEPKYDVTKVKIAEAVAEREEARGERALEALHVHAPGEFSLPGDIPAIVRHGPGLEPEQRAELQGLVVGKGKLIDFDDPKFENKAFYHYDFPALKRDAGGIKLLHIMRDVLDATLTANDTYKVAAIFLVARKGDGSPMHQDTKKGAFVYNRGGITGLRLLYDLGSPTGAEQERKMVFSIDERGPGERAPQLREVFSTSAGLVVMDAPAAGYGRLSKAWHGRKGDGVTVSVDLALKSEHADKGTSVQHHDKTLYNFFQARLGVSGKPRHAGVAPENTATAKAAARTAAVVAVVAAGGTLEPLHCWWCASASKFNNWTFDKNARVCRACYASGLHKSASAAERPAAKEGLCDGCAGCTRN